MVSIERRVSAVIALVGVSAVGVLLIAFLIRSGLSVLIGLIGFAITVAGAWWVITERAVRRILGAVAIVVGLIIIALGLAHVVSTTDGMAFRLFIAILILAISTAAARYALAPTIRELTSAVPQAARRPEKPVLICNPKSGDGKVERFGVVAAAHELGVETIILGPDDDLEQLARDAVARGADCLGMAGGDGSQALVASVAIEHDIPFVCVSAGTRNHFALDLGLDREDPLSTLRAFTDGIERRVDYATMDDRLFVNNVSLGVYATVVQQESYRADKAGTAAAMLPELLGSTAEPFDLQFTTPSGQEIDGAFMILVSNNPYAATFSPDSATRRSMDTGQLGVIAVSTATSADAVRLMTMSAIGLRKASPFWHEFTTESLEIRSRSGRAFAGVDGEALDLPTPMHFQIHAEGLRLRVPAENSIAAARRKARDVSTRALLQVAAGHQPDQVRRTA